MSTNDLTRTVPATDPAPAEMLREIHRAIYVGDGKVGGSPGILQAVDQLRADVAALKAERDRRLTWWHGLALAAAGGGIGQVIGYVLNHRTPHT